MFGKRSITLVERLTWTMWHLMNMEMFWKSFVKVIHQTRNTKPLMTLFQKLKGISLPSELLHVTHKSRTTTLLL